jgi:hypothetical protein
MFQTIAFTARSRLPSITPRLSTQFKVATQLPAPSRFVRPYIKPTKLNMAPSKEEKDKAHADTTNNRDDVEGEHNEWKFKVPYKVHENDPNFKALYDGSCHCGRVQYQLSRKKPLDAKFCHCSTCQTLHGMLISFSQSRSAAARRIMRKRLTVLIRSAIPMGCYFPQRGHQLHSRPPRLRLVRPW